MNSNLFSITDEIPTCNSGDQQHETASSLAINPSTSQQQQNGVSNVLGLPMNYLAAVLQQQQQHQSGGSSFQSPPQIQTTTHQQQQAILSQMEMLQKEHETAELLSTTANCRKLNAMPTVEQQVAAALSQHSPRQLATFLGQHSSSPLDQSRMLSALVSSALHPTPAPQPLGVLESLPSSKATIDTLIQQIQVDYKTPAYFFNGISRETIFPHI